MGALDRPAGRRTTSTVDDDRLRRAGGADARRSAASAVDTDEVAAYLEAGGVNDRVAARDFGVTSVFSLAARLRVELPGPTAGTRRPPAPAGAGRAGRAPAAPPSRATLVRAALYLTPAVVAVGAAEPVRRAAGAGRSGRAHLRLGVVAGAGVPRVPRARRDRRRRARPGVLAVGFVGGGRRLGRADGRVSG